MAVIATVLLVAACACVVRPQNMVGSQTVSIAGLGTVSGTFRQEEPVPFDRVTSFLAIPYASAPINERRFLPPQPRVPWTGILSANTPRTCLSAVGGEEDCLRLNIYVPGTFDVTRNLPVIVYIHGGGLVGGSPYEYEPNDLIKDRNDNEVILVTVSYRLGVLGFMTTGDDVISGNMGLLDQAMAIQWVYDHIASFGGDRTRITLLGQSAGALSVLAHVVSSRTGVRPFQRVIMQSAPVASKLPPRSSQSMAFMEYARGLNCTEEAVSDVVECLRGIDAQELLTAAGASDLSRLVIDGVMITENLVDALATADLTGLTAIIGFNSEDGGNWLPLTYSLDQTAFDNILTNGLPQGSPEIERAFGFCLHVAVSEVGGQFDGSYDHVQNDEMLTNVDFLLNEIRGRYLPDDSNALTNAHVVLDVIRDCFYVAPALEIATVFAMRDTNAHVYVFDHFRVSSIGQAGGIQLHAEHGAEMPYVFGLPLTDSTYSSGERALSESILAGWRSFARTGVPTHTDLGSQPKSWPAYDVTNKQYLRLDTHSLSGADGISSTTTEWERMRVFWRDVTADAVFTSVTVASTDMTHSTDMSPSTDSPNPQPNRESSSSEEFESEYLKLSEFEADLVILLLAIGCVAILLVCIGLTIKVCRDQSDDDKYNY